MKHTYLYDGDIYDQKYRFSYDIPFYLAYAKRARGPVLEIGCGTGRVTIPLARAGVPVTGLDLKASMLKRARQKAAVEGVRVKWVRADCRNFALRQKFELICAPFTAMQHVLDRRSVEKFLTRVHKHLSNKGLFIVDVMNPSMSMLSLSATTRRLHQTIKDQDGRRIRIDEVIQYDDAAQIMELLWYYSMPRKKDFCIDRFRLRCFFPQELDALLSYNGFRIRDKFGDHQKTPFRAGSPRQIVICQKA